MSAPRIKTSIANCYRKVRYNTEEQARASASVLCEQKKQKCASVYYCKTCGGWHITHKPGPRRMRVTASRTHIRPKRDRNSRRQ